MMLQRKIENEPWDKYAFEKRREEALREGQAAPSLLVRG
jgi:hypothetical protein